MGIISSARGGFEAIQHLVVLLRACVVGGQVYVGRSVFLVWCCGDNYSDVRAVSRVCLFFINAF
jgi:hypothetical protein